MEINELEAPITLEELQSIVAEMANQKFPGPDGLSTEIYKRYGEVMLPELLRMLGKVAAGGRMPSSMAEATIVVIPKEGKDQMDTSSYRPISLLCSDAKILAKVLAAMVNKYIQNLIHPDQSGFIPNRSTNINVRRVYLNLQIPSINGGSRVVVSLDAAKAFDSLEWDFLWRALEVFGFGPTFIGWVKALYKTPSAVLPRAAQWCSG